MDFCNGCFLFPIICFEVFYAMHNSQVELCEESYLISSSYTLCRVVEILHPLYSFLH
jgi:hypothetical protein